MFSIFHGLFTLFAIGIDGHNKRTENEANKNRAKTNGQLTYYGARGNEYLVENDRWIYEKYNNKHEVVIVDMKTGKEYYNLTEMKKKQKEDEMLSQGKTVRSKMENEYNKFCGEFRQSFSEVDIKTRIPVNKVYINGVYFYIRLTDGHLLRLADGETLQYLHGKWTVDELIRIVNKRQDEYTKTIEHCDSMNVRKMLFFNMTHVYVDNNGNVNVYSGYQDRQWQNHLKKENIVYDLELNKWINKGDII